MQQPTQSAKNPPVYNQRDVMAALEAANFTKKQQDGLLNALDAVTSSLSTKTDLKNLEESLNQKLDLKISNLRAEIFRMMFIQTGVQVGLIVALIKLL